MTLRTGRHDVLKGSSVEVAGHLFLDERLNEGLPIGGVSCYVGRKEQARGGPEGVGGRERFERVGQHVEGGPSEVAVPQHADQRREVEGFAPPDVDHDGAFGQGAQGPLVHHVVRLGRMRQSEKTPVGGGEGVSPGQVVEQGVKVVQAALDVSLHARHVQPVGLKRLREILSDGPGAEDESAGGEGEQREGLRPRLPPLLEGEGRNAPCQRPGQRQGVPGNDGGGPRKARQGNPALGKSALREMIRALGCRLDPAEVGACGRAWRR